MECWTEKKEELPSIDLEAESGEEGNPIDVDSLIEEEMPSIDLEAETGEEGNPIDVDSLIEEKRKI